MHHWLTFFPTLLFIVYVYMFFANTNTCCTIKVLLELQVSSRTPVYRCLSIPLFIGLITNLLLNSLISL